MITAYVNGALTESKNPQRTENTAERDGPKNKKVVKDVANFIGSDLSWAH
jgi:hypothetical protein